MTEAEWLTCDEVDPMYGFLFVGPVDRASKRQERLFRCACVRRVWPFLEDARTRTLVEVCERYADGLASAKAFGDACDQADEARDAAIAQSGKGSFEHAFATVTVFLMGETPSQAAYAVLGRLPEELKEAEQAAQAAILRDIFGNPFRPARLDSAWTEWNEQAVPKLAQAIYDERSFDRLPVLADALEEAGCTDADILGHCRQPGEHVRGCWVVDLLLGKS